MPSVCPGAGTDPETYFYLQDANYNVVAVMDDDGDVLTQYTYTPYGDLIHVDDLSGTVAAPVNRFLHQGLPLERFYAKENDDLTTDAILLVIDPETGESPLGLYINRNRCYIPALGRFTSADPNATAMPIVTALAFNAEALDTLLSGLDAASHYGDGMNLYIYLGSNPVNRLDALGLSWGIDDDIDDLIADLQGHRLYALGALNEGARIAALGLNRALIVAGAVIGVDVFKSVAAVWSGKGGLWTALDIVLTANPLGRAGKIIAKGFKWMRRGSKAGKVVLKMIKHHTVPTAVLKQLKKLNPRTASKVYGRSRGSNRIKWDIPQDIHDRLHGKVGVSGYGWPGGAWNTAWENEIAAAGGYKTITADRIYKIRDRLVKWFEIEGYRP